MAPRHRVFLDSNVVLYLLSGDARKADTAEGLLEEHPTVSVQVLSETVNVCRRKLAMPWREIHALFNAVTRYCPVVPLDLHVHQTAMFIAQRDQLSFYDAQIVAAALHADCDLLMSEDLHNGLKIVQLCVRNPFAA